MTLVHAQSVGIGISPRGRTSRTSLQRCCCACRSKPKPLAVGALLSCESLALRHRPPQASHRADILLWGTHLEISGPQCVLGRYKTVFLSLGSVQANATSGLPLSLTLRFVPRGPTPTSLRPSHQPGTPVQYKVVGLLAPVRGGGCVFFKIKP